ncbi:hypothetical protein, partial [Mesorhizobium sp. M2D.F.Ca.ET.140.01.1.1]
RERAFQASVTDTTKPTQIVVRHPNRRVSSSKRENGEVSPKLMARPSEDIGSCLSSLPLIGRSLDEQEPGA